ncbi:hypothetical protein Lser_V15G03601 [Lactuca serriola]
MAEIAATAVITVLCEKLISGDLMKLARSKGNDSHLNKWKNTLPMIQAVLADASQQKIKQRAVQLWVNNLQDLTYHIDDVLHDLATEALRRKLNQEAHASTSTSKVLKIILNCCTNFTPRNIMYGQKISSRLDEITTKLDDLIVLKNSLGLNVNVESSNMVERRLEENSLVDESKVMGREGDKEALLRKLLGNEESDQNVSIVSIVGMGGIGKTTLAKVLYNEEKVKGHFEVSAWVCVSEEFNVFNISKAIFQVLTGTNKDFANLNLLHVWELLQSPLLVGASGSRVIATIRSTKVASVMDLKEVYGLDVLSNEDALSLFAQQALGEKNFDKHPTLKLLGECMVQKCGRLPLALKTLGRVVKGNRDGDEWEKLLKSEIWDIEDGGEILPALRISYYHLPPHLKQLFAYCSLIPKDYVFDKNKLVLLWVAEGFLSQSKGNKSMELLGHQYFEEPKSRSFFQQSMNDELGYTMHDMINDLATSVAGEFSFRLDGEMDVSDVTNETFEKFRHFSLVVSWRNDDFLDKFLDKLLPGLQVLRVLSVMSLNTNHYIYQQVTKVPESIGSLKHLRYLNFSYTKITCLPEQVSDLYHLQSLLVHHCKELSSLPRSFAKLINLRHLEISDTPNLNKLPLGIGGLMSLQTLPKVFIEEGYGFKISDLKGLSDLQGQLSIIGLDKVVNSIQAKDANLHQKKGLEVLEMEWSDNVFDESRDETIEYEVLKELRPHPKLKIFKILYNKGTRFPSWIGDPSFDQLTEITLRGCRSTQLPTLGCLGSLKKLSVERMKEVKTVGFEFHAPTNSSFPRLHEISISSCPELAEVSIGLIPSLQVLYIEECSEEVLKGMVGVSSSLVELKILDVKGLIQLHGEDLMHLGALEHININSCDELRYLWERESEAWQSLVSLQKLEVSCCKKLVASAEKDVTCEITMVSLKLVMFIICETLETYSCPNSVERLEIRHCDSLTSLTFSAVQEHPSSPLTESIVSDCDNISPEKDFGFLPRSHLTSLEINGCKNLKSFPHEHFQSLTSLEELSIEVCPSMGYSFPCGVWPPNLTKLTIGCLNKPMSEWGPQNFPTSLVQLNLYGKNSGVVSFVVEDDVRNTITSFIIIFSSSTISGFSTAHGF